MWFWTNYFSSEDGTGPSVHVLRPGSFTTPSWAWLAMTSVQLLELEELAALTRGDKTHRKPKVCVQSVLSGCTNFEMSLPFTALEAALLYPLEVLSTQNISEIPVLEPNM